MCLTTPSSSPFNISLLKYLQVYDRVEVNNKAPNPPLVALPVTPSNGSHGTVFYNKTRSPVGWFWGNTTLDVTTASVLVSGPSDASLQVVPMPCPPRGCNVLAPVAADFRSVHVSGWHRSELCAPLYPRSMLNMLYQPASGSDRPAVTGLTTWVAE